MSAPRVLDFRRPWERRPGGAALFLAPLGLLVGVAAALNGRRLAGRARRCVRPVISIGNLEAGGTGKTPAVLALATLLLEAGRRPGIVTGLWGRDAEGRALLASDDPAFADAAPDEARLLAARLPGVPVLAARRKVEGALALDGAGACELILVDDGFQHRGLVRDLDLVRLSPDAPLSPWRVLPAGPLREFPGALARADAFVLRPGQRAPAGKTVFVLEWVSSELRDLDGAPATPARVYVTAAGIARPEGFEKAARARLATAGAQVREHLRFADHADWTPRVRARLGAALERHPGARFLLTEKDAHRWASSSRWDLSGPPPQVLAQEHRFQDPAALLALIDQFSSA